MRLVRGSCGPSPYQPPLSPGHLPTVQCDVLSVQLLLDCQGGAVAIQCRVAHDVPPLPARDADAPHPPAHTRRTLLTSCNTVSHFHRGPRAPAAAHRVFCTSCFIFRGGRVARSSTGSSSGHRMSVSTSASSLPGCCHSWCPETGYSVPS